MEKLLSDKDIQKIIGKGRSKIVTYPELSNYNNIEELFGNKNIVILLFINEIVETNNSLDIIGHWSVLTRKNINNKCIIEFMDSYSLEPDEIKNDCSDEFLIESEQKDNILTKLLYDFTNNHPYNEVHYNEIPFQSSDSNIATCGRWVAMRAKFMNVPLEKYQRVFKKMEKKNFDLDKLIVFLTDSFL